jgi:hypothetical protein
VEGFVTILFSSPEKPIVSQGFVWNALQRAGFSDRLTREVKGLQVRGMGCARAGRTRARSPVYVDACIGHRRPPVAIQLAGVCGCMHCMRRLWMIDRTRARTQVCLDGHSAGALSVAPRCPMGWLAVPTGIST